ncbi:MAG: hypothetical protein KKB79_01365 [Nanoarchaeota archaeon]|nr:hypothetical protein [Nanoarchaeota archaeon]
MIEQNKRIYCGANVLDVSKRECDLCKKKPKKKVISNFEIEAKYEKSRERIKSILEDFIYKIDRELSNLKNPREKFILNDFNQDLLKFKISKLLSLRTLVIEAWDKCVGES